jgi:flagellin
MHWHVTHGVSLFSTTFFIDIGEKMIGSLDSASSTLSTSMNRLSSGSRINSAKDDPSGLQIASQMGAQISSAGMAMSNMLDGLSLTQTAAGGLGQVSNTLQRLRELAVQSSNGVNSATDRQALQAEFSQLSNSLDSTAGQVQFNGQNLLDGTFNSAVQTGPNAGDTLNLTLGNVSSSALGVSTLDISTSAGSASALSAIDQAISSVGNLQSNVGAVESGLEASSASLSSNIVNLSASRSAINDTDYAQTSSEMSLAKVKQQVSLKVAALYNSNQSNLFKLLPG